MTNIDKKIIGKILDEAVRAPSGDNLQPWSFEFNQDYQLNVYLKEELDNYFFNPNNEASLISIGALLETIKIVSSNYHLQTSIDYYPNLDKKHLVATIKFSKNKTIQTNSLYKYISSRSSNRHLYENRNISVSILNKLKNTTRPEESEIYINNKKEDIFEIAKSITITEEVVLNNKELRNIFFSDIRWTQKEERVKKRGLYINTLELNSIAKIFFKFYSFNWLASMLNRINFYKIILKENTKLYQSSPYFGAIAIPDDNNISWIKAGETLQRMWLIATKHSCAIQLVTGVIFLNRRIKSNNKLSLSNKHIEKIQNNFDIIKKKFNAESKTLAVIFRMGYAPSPSATTSRMKPIIEG